MTASQVKPTEPATPAQLAAEAAKLAEQRRWGARTALREFSSAKRQKFCGLPGSNAQNGGDITLRATRLPRKERAHGKQYAGGYAGLFSCGNVWTCPCCGLKIGAARAAELAHVMGHVVEAGGTAALFTFTMRHSRKHQLADCWDAIGGAWSNIIGHRDWVGGDSAVRDAQGKYVRVPGTARPAVRDAAGDLVTRAYPGKIAKAHRPGLAEEYDVFGWDKNIDITHGFENGWHVHAHVVVMFNGRPSPERIEELGHKMFALWAGHFEGTEFGTPLRDSGGFDAQHIDFDVAEGKVFDSIAEIAKYVSKGLAMESNLAGFKKAKGGNRTMMELLLDATEPADIVLTGGEVQATIDLTARALFGEYERVSKGRKMNSSSDTVRELRKRLAPETADKTDEEIAEEELGGEDIAVIPRLEWYKMARRAVYLKQVLEFDGIEAAYAWLDRAKIAWHKPTGLSEHYRRDAVRDLVASRQG